ncbi:MAG: PQQ-binding-like beta-propeller repeat protein [Planctomycetes bacterium]|nr:PQQ-binding-like beta-propeller repeat protein [Planctomycetota bacterium]
MPGKLLIWERLNQEGHLYVSAEEQLATSGHHGNFIRMIIEIILNLTVGIIHHSINMKGTWIMYKIRRYIFLSVMLLGLLQIQSDSDANELDQAAEILKATGLQGGLVIHINCGDGKLTAALGAREGYLVNGLDKNPQAVKAATRHIQSSGLSGKVTVERWSGTHLPYIDNLVNLLVAEDVTGVSMEEVMRVLRPGGTAYIKKKSKWNTIRKPWPKDIDEWTHYLHDASGNAVSQDKVVGPPRHMQWQAAPEWSRNHHNLASISSVVSAQGRLFYIVDEATSGSMQVPGKWSLTARDAFNGVLLWKQPISSWAWEQQRFRSGPVQLPRLLVAVNDRVYIPLGLNEAVSALDAATGKVVTTYGQTKGTEEIILNEGVLLVVKGKPFAEQAATHPQWKGKKSTANVKSILAININTNEELWTWQERDSARLIPLTLTAKNNRVFFQTDNTASCLDLRTGKSLWYTTLSSPKIRKSKKGKASTLNRKLGWSTATLVVHDEIVLWADEGILRALSVIDGSQLWQCPCKAGFKSPVDVFVTDGLIWIGPDYNVGRDLMSGQVKRRLLGLDDLRTVGHHHRCYREKATSQYIIGGYRGMEFFDLDGNNHSRNNWIRGTCQYGILPCNGLVYAPSHACGCFMEAKLYGFWALSAQMKRSMKTEDRRRLEKGPDYNTYKPASSLTGTTNSPAEWPTYRHDVLRSGSTPSAVPLSLKKAWQVKAAEKISQPVIAKGTVVISAIDEHRVIALDANDGSNRWTFTAGGRVDSPPTIYGDLVFFGSADGHLYCLRLKDGELVWRFRASPQDFRTVAFDRLESVWPVHGSVLVLDSVIYVTAGRSSYLDGGIYMFGLEPSTGKVLYQTRIRSAHPKADEGKEGPIEMSKKLTQNATDAKTFQAPDLSDAFSMKGGTTTDVLVSDGESIYLRTFRFNRQCVRQQQMASHLFSTSSILDGHENHRSHLMIGTGDFSRIPVAYSWIANNPGRHNSQVVVPYGLTLVFDDKNIWGVRRTKGYTLYADVLKPFTADEEELPDLRTAPKSVKPTWKWSESIDIRPRALVRAGEVLLLGGTPGLSENENVSENFVEFEGHGKGMLWFISAKDGTKTSTFNLEAPPIWDGIAVANERLYISRADGVLECLSGN